MFGYPNWRIDALESVLHFFMLSIYFLKIENRINQFIVAKGGLFSINFASKILLHVLKGKNSMIELEEILLINSVYLSDYHNVCYF